MAGGHHGWSQVRVQRQAFVPGGAVIRAYALGFRAGFRGLAGGSGFRGGAVRGSSGGDGFGVGRPMS